jgi:hypothetical protein
MSSFTGDASNLIHEDYQGFLVHTGRYIRWSRKVHPVSFVEDPVHVDRRVVHILEVFSSYPSQQCFAPTFEDDREDFYREGDTWAEKRCQPTIVPIQLEVLLGH